MTSAAVLTIIGGRRPKRQVSWYLGEGPLVFAYQIKPPPPLTRPQMLRKGV